jgi:hypothetical protein
MQIQRTVMTLVLAVSGALLAGCAGSFHYSELKGERFNRTNIDTSPVTITQVDGRSIPMWSRIWVEPGLRQITVVGPTGGAGRSDRLSTELQVGVCMRYWLVAVRSNRLNSDFELVVDHEEPMPGCTPRPGA